MRIGLELKKVIININRKQIIYLMGNLGNTFRISNLN